MADPALFPKRRPPGDEHKPVTRDERLQILSMKYTNWGAKKIGEAMGLSRTTVEAVIQQGIIDSNKGKGVSPTLPLTSIASGGPVSKAVKQVKVSLRLNPATNQVISVNLSDIPSLPMPPLSLDVHWNIARHLKQKDRAKYGLASRVTAAAARPHLFRSLTFCDPALKFERIAEELGGIPEDAKGLVRCLDITVEESEQNDKTWARNVLSILGQQGLDKLEVLVIKDDGDRVWATPLETVTLAGLLKPFPRIRALSIPYELDGSDSRPGRGPESDDDKDYPSDDYYYQYNCPSFFRWKARSKTRQEEAAIALGKLATTLQYVAWMATTGESSQCRRTWTIGRGGNTVHAGLLKEEDIDYEGYEPPQVFAELCGIA